MNARLTLAAIASLTSLSIAVFWWQPAHATTKPKQKLNITLIGDSYSAGNGAGYYTGVKNCYRSQRNWAQFYINYLNSNGIATTFQNRACSGGKIEDLYNYRQLNVYTKTITLDGDWTADNNKTYHHINNSGVCKPYTVDDSIESRLSITNSLYLPSTNQTHITYQCFQRLRPQLEFIGPETDLVLMTIGGNDLQFADIIRQCFFFRSKTKCKKLINDAQSLLPDIKNDLVGLFRKMRQYGLRPDAKVVLLGYPLLALNVPYHIGPPTSPYFVAQEIRNLGLAGNQAQAAAVAIDNRSHPGQITFLSTVPDWFDGHEPHPAFFKENPNRWLHEFSGYSLLDGHGFYHPNPTGHANYASLLNRKLPASQVQQFAKPLTPTSSNVDVVFNIDTSGSMDYLLDHVKAKMKEIVQQLQSKSTSVRFAITSFRDHPERSGDEIDYPAKVDLNFSSDPTQIQRAIKQLKTGNGGDIPETALSGILSGLNLQWRAGVHKVVVTITDAPPHDPEPISGLTSAQIIKRAFEVDPAELYFIDIDFTQEPKPTYSMMAEATGGQVFSTNTELVSNILLKSINHTTSKPHAWINGPYITKLNEPLEINGAGSYSKLGQIVKYEWDFDSNGVIDFISTEPIITHTFKRELYGLMSLKVTDEQGLSSIANTHLIVSQDGDDVPTKVDNCPLVDNHSQTDSDQDGIGDLCDETPGIELPEEHRDYYECLIKRYFHPSTDCQHLVLQSNQQPSPTQPANQPSLLEAAPSNPTSAPTTTYAISNAPSAIQPQNHPDYKPIISRYDTATIAPLIPKITAKQLDRAQPQTTDPKWLWMALPIIIASLFGGYFLLQQRRH